jgi:hypothetical protein
MEQAHKELAGSEQDNRRDDRRHNHAPAHSPLRFRVEAFGFFEEWHQCDFGPIPMSKSRSSFNTSSTLISEKSIAWRAFSWGCADLGRY